MATKKKQAPAREPVTIDGGSVVTTAHVAPPASPLQKTDVNQKGQREPGVDKIKAEETQVKYWADRVRQAEDDPDQKAWREGDLKKWRKYVQGLAHSDGTSGLVRTNLIFSTIATNLPHIYAKDPEIEVSLTQAVPEEQYEVFKDFAASLQSMLDSLFVNGAKLKSRAKSAVRATMTTSVGWCKLIYQCDVRKDPLTQARINDSQDNIERIKTLIQKIGMGEKEGNPDELAPLKMELEEQLRSLADDTEVSTAHGLIMDRVQSEDILILDSTIKDFDYYVEADAIANNLWMTADMYQDRFGYVLPEGVTSYARPEIPAGENGTGSNSSSPASSGGDGTSKPAAFYRVIEIWQKSSNTIYTYAKGAKVWAREPYQPKEVGERWYPFFCLGFNPVDGRWRPMSDVELLIELQDEYNTTRTNYAEARKSAIPVLIVRSGGQLTPEDIKNIENRKMNQIIVVEGTPNQPIAQEIAFLPTADIKPEVYDTSQIRADFDQVSGTADAARGNITKAKTATEADILQQGLMSRADERRDVMEDWVGEMAQYSAEIILRVFTRPQVARLIGDKAAARWPQMSVDRIFEMVQIRIKAGSSGRPNAQKEREQWIQLLPEIQKTIEGVFALQAGGNPMLAKTSIELLKETLKRFDEYIDLDRFIPPGMQSGGDDATAQMMQQMQQLQQQLQQLQEQNQELQEEAAKLQQTATTAQQGAQLKEQAAASAHELAMQQNEIEDARTQRVEAEENKRAQRTSRQTAIDMQKKLAFEEELAKLKLESAENIEIMKLKLGAEQADKDRVANEKANNDKLASADKANKDKLTSSESIADKGHAAAAAAGDKDRKHQAAEGGKDREHESAEGGKDRKHQSTEGGKDREASADGAAPAAGDQDKVMGQLAAAIGDLADVIGSDKVPVRDKKGNIERVVVERKPKGKKTAGGSGVAQLAAAVGELSSAVAADRVPVKDDKGNIERVTVKRKPAKKE